MRGWGSEVGDIPVSFLSVGPFYTECPTLSQGYSKQLVPVCRGRG